VDRGGAWPCVGVRDGGGVRRPATAERGMSVVMIMDRLGVGAEIRAASWLLGVE
jgi:hypothetical protein